MNPTDSSPIVCSLQGASYQERTEWIARLTRDGLLGHQRSELALELRYAPEVAERVRIMVRQEQECCPFLNFSLEEGNTEIRLTVTAPEQARDVVEDLFQVFVQTAVPPSGQGAQAHRC